MARGRGRRARPVAGGGRGPSGDDQPAAPAARAARRLARRAEIGAYIAAVVDHCMATLVNRLELQVGKDLQYIRINGTLVGGRAGSWIFTLSRAFGG